MDENELIRDQIRRAYANEESPITLHEVLDRAKQAEQASRPKQASRPRRRRRRDHRFASFWNRSAGQMVLTTAVATGVLIVTVLLNLHLDHEPITTEATPQVTRATPQATRATPQATSATGSAGVFRQTGADPVVVPERFGIDLDAQESNWGISPFAYGDVYVAPGVDSVRGNRLAIVDARPTLEDCEAQTVLQRYLTKAQTVVGQQMCVQSSGGRWAHVRIVAIDRSARTMTFKIVVWKLHTDP
jgi:hypothetical protein